MTTAGGQVAVLTVRVAVLSSLMKNIGALAINRTGGADLIASGLAVVAGGLPPAGAMSLMLVRAMALTPFLNNAAMVLIMAPIGVSLAARLGLQPEPEPFLGGRLVGTCRAPATTPLLPHVIADTWTLSHQHVCVPLCSRLMTAR